MRIKWPVLLLGVLVAAAGIWAARTRSEFEAPPKPVDTAEGRRPSSKENVDGSLSPVAQNADASPLPAVDQLSVPALLAELEPRALAGDPAAACRLASELARCRMIALWDEGAAARLSSELARSTNRNDEIERLIESLAQTHEYNVGVKQRCDGIAREQYRRLPRLTYMAAKAGHIPSMLDFASATVMNSEDLLSDPEFYNTYRLEAWPMFLRAFEAGDPRAATEWALALQSPNRLLYGVMPAEWRRPGLVRALLERMRRDLPADATHRILQPSLGEDSRPTEEERAEAEEIYARRFERSPWMQQLLTDPSTPPEALRLQLSPQHCALKDSP